MLFSPSAAELHVLPIGESAPGFSGCRESSHLGSVSSVLLEAGWLDQVAVPDLLYQSPAAVAAAVCCDALLLTSSSFSSSMLLCPSSAVQLVDTTLAFYCEPPPLSVPTYLLSFLSTSLDPLLLCSRARSHRAVDTQTE